VETETDDRPYVMEGRTIKAYRIVAGITQRELSAETSIPLSMIREYEQGRCLPGSERLIVIMVRLGIPATAFTLPRLAAVASGESA
jgi:transcriptional regulator with XRE-family HTH domain